MRHVREGCEIANARMWYMQMTMQGATQARQVYNYFINIKKALASEFERASKKF